MSETNLNTNFNVESAVLAIVQNQVETENNLFVSNMTAAIEANKDAFDLANRRHDKAIKAANKQLVADGVQAAASGAQGVSSGVGAARMKSKLTSDVKPDSSPDTQVNQQKATTSTEGEDSIRATQSPLDNSPTTTTQEAIGGSAEFQDQFNAKQRRIDNLQERKANLGSEAVNDPKVKELQDATPDDVQRWRNEQQHLQDKKKSSQLTDSEQRKLENLGKDIENYDELSHVNTKIGDTINQRDQLVIDQRRMRNDQARFQMEAIGQMSHAILSGISAKFRQVATVQQINADRDNTAADWKKTLAASLRDLANSARSDSKTPIDTYNSILNTEASVIGKLTTRV